MGWFNLRKNTSSIGNGAIDRGATINPDFIPLDGDGHILHLSDFFGCSPDFSNINTSAGQAMAYKIVRDVKTVINRRSEIFRNGKVWVLDENMNEPTSQEANDVRALLENPNPLQTWADFYTQQKIYKYVFGFCPVYKVRPIGMQSAKALYNILPTIFDIDYTGKLYHQTNIRDIIKSYKIRFGGIESLLDIDDVYISRDINISLDPVNLLPESRLTALRYDAALVQAIGNARFSMVEKRGALGILSNQTKDSVGAVAVTEDEKKELQESYEKYGITTHKSKLIISNANLVWQQMAIAVKDLQLIELGEDAKIQIADMYGYPPELLGSKNGTTYVNKNVAEKGLYQNSIIPEAKGDSEAFTKFLGLKTCYIDIDFSEIPVLQEDRKLNAETLRNTVDALEKAFANKIITQFEYRKQLSTIINIDPNTPDDGQKTNTLQS